MHYHPNSKHLCIQTASDISEGQLIFKVHPDVLATFLHFSPDSNPPCVEDPPCAPCPAPPVHVYLGSPPFDDDQPTIEEHPETLAAALRVQQAYVPVIFSGCIDIAHAAKLISRADFLRFRRWIQALDP